MDADQQEDPREVLSDLRDLVKCRGWARLNSLAQAQVKTRTASVLGPGGGDEKEFQKGEIAGINLFMNLPGVAIENLRRQIEEQESHDETAAPDDAA